MARKIAVDKLWTTYSLAGSSAVTSTAVDIQGTSAMALYLTAISGTTPSLTFTYSLAPTLDATFQTPTAPATIGATKSAADVMDFAPEVGGAIKIITTNNGTGTVVFSAALVRQEAA